MSHISVKRAMIALSAVLAMAAGATGETFCPDNGLGTVEIHDQLSNVYAGGHSSEPDSPICIDGLPPGTEILGTMTWSDFDPTPMTPGGSLGGDTYDYFTSTLEIQMHGTGMLAGWTRNLNMEISGECHTGPRNPGDPVQSFDNEMWRLQGGIVGDPDFSSLTIVAGTDYGLPSPGQTVLKRVPDGNYAVDSFFDVSYQVDFIGAPGSVLDGMFGATTAVSRFSQREAVDPSSGRDLDLYRTMGGEFHFDGPNPPLPADFFGPGSDPFEGQVALIPATPPGDPDTTVRRVSPGDLPFPGDSAVIDTEIVSMSLVSAEPIRVTRFAVDSFFDVYFEIDVHPPDPCLTLDRETVNVDDNAGDIAAGTMVILPRMTFVNVADPLEFYELDYAAMYGQPVVLTLLSDNEWSYLEPDGLIFTSAENNRYFVPRPMFWSSSPFDITMTMAALPGDANVDGLVDIQDFGILKDHYGLPGVFEQGDFNGDGLVDMQDFGLLKNNYGLSGPLNVPEPCTLALLAMGALALRRRSRE